MHPAAASYISEAVEKYVGPADGLSVLEFGSYNVNGTVRDYFPNSDFFGIDVREGPCVDFVCDAAEFDGEGRYDVVISAETLEHAPRPKEIIQRAWDSLRPGGILILTAGGPDRTPHNADGGHDDLRGEHYQNIYPDQLEEWLAGWKILSLVHNEQDKDVYATAVKRG